MVSFSRGQSQVKTAFYFSEDCLNAVIRDVNEIEDRLISDKEATFLNFKIRLQPGFNFLILNINFPLV